MAFNFRKIQQEYPDAIKVVATRVAGADPVPLQSLVTMAGGGRIIYFRASEKSYTIICSKMAALQEVANG